VPDVGEIAEALSLAVGAFTSDFAALSPGILIVLVPILIAHGFLRRWIVSGFAAGAIRAEKNERTSPLRSAEGLTSKRNPCSLLLERYSIVNFHS
jgi:hypothetical protein